MYFFVVFTKELFLLFTLFCIFLTISLYPIWVVRVSKERKTIALVEKMIMEYYISKMTHV